MANRRNPGHEPQLDLGPQGGTSLWLVPAAVEMEMIRSSFPRLPSETDHPPSLSPSSYPAFLPHITLASVTSSKPDVSDVLLDAVPKIDQPVRANFQDLTVGDHYFRSVFIDVQPTQELIDLQSQISTNLRGRGLEPRAPRFPHMSLCYIADEDKDYRKRTAQVLRDTGVVSQKAEQRFISLRCGDVDLSGFHGTQIWLISCEGPVDTWKVNEKVDLISKA